MMVGSCVEYKMEVREKLMMTAVRALNAALAHPMLSVCLSDRISGEGE